MSVQTFNPTDLSQSAANWAVAQRMVGPFAPHAQVVPNMTVAVDPGYLLSGTTLTEVNAQSTNAITPPASGFRIDRVVVDRTTGAVSVIAGTPNSLTPPALASGKLPVARVFLESTTTAITNDSIVDERALFDLTPDSSVVSCRATLGGTNQTGVPSNTSTKINLNTTEFNVGNGFDTVNKWFKPSVPGYYMMHGQAVTLLELNKGIATSLYKNGTSIASDTRYYAVNNSISSSVTDITYLNGTTDYVELYFWHNNSVAGTIQGHPISTYFTASRIG